MGAAMLVEALQNLLLTITGQVPAPAAGAALDHCDPRIRPTASNAAAIAAEIDTLVRQVTRANTLLNSGKVRIVRDPLLTAGGPTHGHETARTVRETDPSLGVAYSVGVNLSARRFTIFTAASAIFHELQHVRDADAHGFLTYEVPGLVTEEEYVALTWQFELEAFKAQRQDTHALYQQDPARYRECWHWLLAIHPTLKQLHANNAVAARRELRKAYPESDLRADWQQRHTAAVAPTIAAAFAAFKAAGHMDAPAGWGL